MSTHTMELEAYGAYCEYCLAVGVRAMTLDKWRVKSAIVPSGFAGVMPPRKGAYNPGYSILSPQLRIACGQR